MNTSVSVAKERKIVRAADSKHMERTGNVNDPYMSAYKQIASDMVEQAVKEYVWSLKILDAENRGSRKITEQNKIDAHRMHDSYQRWFHSPVFLQLTNAIDDVDDFLLLLEKKARTGRI